MCSGKAVALVSAVYIFNVVIGLLPISDVLLLGVLCTLGVLGLAPCTVAIGARFRNLRYSLAAAVMKSSQDGELARLISEIDGTQNN